MLIGLTAGGAIIPLAAAAGSFAGFVGGSTCGNVVNSVSDGAMSVAKKSAGNKQSQVKDPRKQLAIEWAKWELKILSL